MNKKEKCAFTDCNKFASFEVRHFERGVVGLYCSDHKGPRGLGYAPFKIGVAECSAEMPDGLPCNHPAKFVVSRPFSGIESVCCGTHRPSRLHVSQGAVFVRSIGQDAA